MPPFGAPRPGGPIAPAGARAPGPGMPPGARPAAAPVPPQAARPAAAPSRPTPPPAAPPTRKDPFGFGFGLGAPAPAPTAPEREDDFGDIDVEPPTPTPPPAAAAPAPDLDDLSMGIEPPAAKTRAPIELPDEPEAPEPELAPMHAFVPPADQVGHKPEPAPRAPAAARDGGEALLREALSKASRDVIERVVWEVVPQLAETIIRENLDRLVKQRQG